MSIRFFFGLYQPYRGTSKQEHLSPDNATSSPQDPAGVVAVVVAVVAVVVAVVAGAVVVVVAGAVVPAVA